MSLHIHIDHKYAKARTISVPYNDLVHTCHSQYGGHETAMRFITPFLALQDRMSYEIGCYSECANKEVCNNGGVCLDVFHPTKNERTLCNCDDTSFIGPRCDKGITVGR